MGCQEHWRFPALLLKLAIGETDLADSDLLEAHCGADGCLSITLTLALDKLEVRDEQLRYDAQMALDSMADANEADNESTERAVQVLTLCLEDPAPGNRRL